MKDLISKFAPAAFVTLLGIIVLVWGSVGEQNAQFMLGGAAIVLAGLIVLLNALGVISNTLSYAASGFMFVIAIYLGYNNYVSIEEPIRFMQEKNKRYSAVIQSLKDIREIQVAFKKENGKYIADFDTLLNFAQNDSVTIVKMFGNVPDTLTEFEALELGIITRDTSRVPAYGQIFNPEYMETRDPRWKLEVSNLRYVPFTDKKEFEMATGTVERGSGIKVQVFQVVDSAPFDPEDVMQVGSLVDPTTAGNWKEEK
ncbi:MAG TPA: hypothetical protein DDX92_09160 [Flavobacteriales bacterium]|jgi:hypothetical protein|nr:hypothetical protein [Flavobacteriales bacterium]